MKRDAVRKLHDKRSRYDFSLLYGNKHPRSNRNCSVHSHSDFFSNHSLC